MTVKEKLEQTGVRIYHVGARLSRRQQIGSGVRSIGSGLRRTVYLTKDVYGKSKSKKKYKSIDMKKRNKYTKYKKKWRVRKWRKRRKR